MENIKELGSYRLFFDPSFRWSFLEKGLTRHLLRVVVVVWFLFRVPFERGVELAQEYRVEQQLKPLLEFEPPPDDGNGMTPSKEEARLEQARVRKEMLERRRIVGWHGPRWN